MLPLTTEEYFPEIVILAVGQKTRSGLDFSTKSELQPIENSFISCCESGRLQTLKSEICPVNSPLPKYIVVVVLFVSNPRLFSPIKLNIIFPLIVKIRFKSEELNETQNEFQEVFDNGRIFFHKK